MLMIHREVEHSRAGQAACAAHNCRTSSWELGIEKMEPKPSELPKLLCLTIGEICSTTVLVRCAQSQKGVRMIRSSARRIGMIPIQALAGDESDNARQDHVDGASIFDSC